MLEPNIGTYVGVLDHDSLNLRACYVFKIARPRYKAQRDAVIEGNCDKNPSSRRLLHLAVIHIIDLGMHS
jgi:hypothetical protein